VRESERGEENLETGASSYLVSAPSVLNKLKSAKCYVNEAEEEEAEKLDTTEAEAKGQCR
jgi:hypothetical protein